MRRIIDGINNWLDSICDDMKNKKWVRGIAKSLLALVIMACTVYFLYILILFLITNMDYIILGVGGIVCLIVFFRGLATKKQPKQTVSPVEQSLSFIQYDPITLENTYTLLRSNICYVIGEVSDILRIRKPASHSQMDAPIHYDIVANVPIYHFLVCKLSDKVDMYNVMGILQNAIEQKLNNNEFSGISQTTFFYNGQAYPAIMVDNVRDLGNMIQIDVAVASEYYCKYRVQRMYNSMNVTNVGNTKDYDF